MDEITLETINNSIKQLNNRINDTNKFISGIKNENTAAHRDINKKVEKISTTISDIDKETSITMTNLDNHLDDHKKEDNATKINGVKLSSLVGNVLAALIGGFMTLKATGVY